MKDGGDHVITVKILRYLSNAFLFLFMLISIFPFYWNIVLAFTPVKDMFSYPPIMLPTLFTLDNFIRLRVYMPYFLRNITNSIFLAIITPCISLFFNSLGGYSFAKFKFKGRDVLFKMMIATMLIPSAAAYIPQFILMTRLRFIDSYFAIILPAAASAFGMFLFRQAMYAVPDELMDAGKIDGAGAFRRYLVIVIPLVKPMLITVYIQSLIYTWNDYFWPFLVLKTERKLTFSVVLAGLRGQFFETPWGILMVGSLILTLPTIIIFSSLSKYIVMDIFKGAIKG
jgi:ABC-type glycerol-3-phosphate transport system permease component